MTLIDELENLLSPAAWISFNYFLRRFNLLDLILFEDQNEDHLRLHERISNFISDPVFRYVKQQIQVSFVNPAINGMNYWLGLA